MKPEYLFSTSIAMAFLSVAFLFAWIVCSSEDEKGKETEDGKETADAQPGERESQKSLYAIIFQYGVLIGSNAEKSGGIQDLDEILRAYDDDDLPKVLALSLATDLETLRDATGGD